MPICLTNLPAFIVQFVASKMAIKDLANFLLSSAKPYHTGEQLQLNPVVPNIYKNMRDAAEVFFKMENGNLFIHFKQSGIEKYVSVVYEGQKLRFIGKIINIQQPLDDDVCIAVTDFFLKTKSTASEIHLNREVDCNPVLLNNFIVATRATKFTKPNDGSLDEPISGDYIRIPAMREMESVRYFGGCLTDRDLHRLTATYIDLNYQYNDFTSYGINRFLKAFLRGERDFEYLFLSTRKPFLYDRVFMDIPYDIVEEVIDELTINFGENGEFMMDVLLYKDPSITSIQIKNRLNYL